MSFKIHTRKKATLLGSQMALELVVGGVVKRTVIMHRCPMELNKEFTSCEKALNEFEKVIRAKVKRGDWT